MRVFDYDYFDNPQAEGYKGYFCEFSGEGLQPDWNEIANFSIELKVKSVLDIGCAKGYLVRALNNAGIESKGYDISQYAIENSVSNECYLKNITDGIDDNFDMIFALGVLLYIERDKLPSILINILEHTNKYFCFSCYYSGELQTVIDDYRVITENHQWWKNEIENAGFVFEKSLQWFDLYARLD